MEVHENACVLKPMSVDRSHYDSNLLTYVAQFNVTHSPCQLFCGLDEHFDALLHFFL